MVQVLDLLAGSPEQPVSHTCSMLCQLPCSTSHHLKRVVMISNLGEYIDLPQMYCDVLSRYLDPGSVLLLNFLPAVVFRLVLNYVMSVGCPVTESLLELHLTSLFLVRLYLDEMVQGLYAQSPVLQFWEWVTLTPVSTDYLIPDLW